MAGIRFGRDIYFPNNRGKGLDDYDWFVKERFVKFDNCLLEHNQSIENFMKQIFPLGITLTGYLAPTADFKERWFFQAAECKGEFIVRFEFVDGSVTSQVAYKNYVFNYKTNHLLPIEYVEIFCLSENFVSWEQVERSLYFDNTFLGRFSKHPSSTPSSKLDNIDLIYLISLIEKGKLPKFSD